MIYPLTICFDRYNGVYSGGLYTAWNCDSENVPTEISNDDVTCADFWRDAKNGHYTFLPAFGVGSTVDEAVENLRKKLNAVEEDHDTETQTSEPVVPVAKVRESLGIAEDSDIFQCIKYRDSQLETLRTELVEARRMYHNAIKERNQFGKRLADIRKAAGMADGDPTDLVKYVEALREKIGENGVLRDNVVDYLEDLAQGRQKALSNLHDDIDKVYCEIFDCSDGGPEGTYKETLRDILNEYKRCLELKNVAEEKTIKYKELARENEEKLAKEKEWTKRLEQKLIEIQDICER